MKNIYPTRFLPWAISVLIFATISIMGVAKLVSIASETDSIEDSIVSVSKHKNLAD